MVSEKLESCPTCGARGDMWNYDSQTCLACERKQILPRLYWLAVEFPKGAKVAYDAIAEIERLRASVERQEEGDDA